MCGCQLVLVTFLMTTVHIPILPTTGTESAGVWCPSRLWILTVEANGTHQTYRHLSKTPLFFPYAALPSCDPSLLCGVSLRLFFDAATTHLKPHLCPHFSFAPPLRLCSASISALFFLGRCARTCLPVGLVLCEFIPAFLVSLSLPVTPLFSCSGHRQPQQRAVDAWSSEHAGLCVSISSSNTPAFQCSLLLHCSSLRLPLPLIFQSLFI